MVKVIPEEVKEYVLEEKEGRVVINWLDLLEAERQHWAECSSRVYIESPLEKVALPLVELGVLSFSQKGTWGISARGVHLGFSSPGAIPLFFKNQQDAINFDKLKYADANYFRDIYKTG